jgi:hypothetical protein
MPLTRDIYPLLKKSPAAPSTWPHTPAFFNFGRPACFVVCNHEKSVGKSEVLHHFKLNSTSQLESFFFDVHQEVPRRMQSDCSA